MTYEEYKTLYRLMLKRLLSSNDQPGSVEYELKLRELSKVEDEWHVRLTNL